MYGDAFFQVYRVFGSGLQGLWGLWKKGVYGDDRGLIRFEGFIGFLGLKRLIGLLGFRGLFVGLGHLRAIKEKECFYFTLRLRVKARLNW